MTETNFHQIVLVQHHYLPQVRSILYCAIDAFDTHRTISFYLIFMFWAAPIFDSSSTHLSRIQQISFLYWLGDEKEQKYPMLTKFQVSDAFFCQTNPETTFLTTELVLIPYPFAPSLQCMSQPPQPHRQIVIDRLFQNVAYVFMIHRPTVISFWSCYNSIHNQLESRCVFLYEHHHRIIYMIYIYIYTFHIHIILRTSHGRSVIFSGPKGKNNDSKIRETVNQNAILTI